MSILQNNETLFFQSVLQSAHNGIIAIDLDGKIIFFNEGAEKITNLHAQEVIGKYIRDVIPQSPLERVLKSKEDYVGSKIKIADKEVVTNQTKIFINNRFIGAMAVFQVAEDIPSYRNQLSQTQALNQQLNAIIESSYDGIYITDGHGVTVRINSAYEGIAGIKADEVIGRSMEELIKDGYINESVSLQVLDKKKVITIMQKLEKTDKHVIVTGNPVYDEFGRVSWIVTNVRDITELNNLKEELEIAKRVTKRYEQEISVLKCNELSEIIGNSKSITDVIETISKVAKVDSTVILMGESGVGKELFANAIYKLSQRSNEPFVRVNCGAISESLIEAELFGYDKGSFTGALEEGKVGLFEMADGGTILLDEISEVPLHMQVKILRVLQEKEIMKVGSSIVKKVDLRIIAATNKNLQELVVEGRFREDLFYRLNVIPIHIPPLRDRKEDIFHLATFFLEKYNRSHNQEKSISNRAMDDLLIYDWPGNVRELQNVIERMVVLSTCNVIQGEDLPLEIRFKRIDTKLITDSLPCAVDRFERELIMQSMQDCDSITEASIKLGIDRTTLSKKIKKYNLKP